MPDLIGMVVRRVQAAAIWSLLDNDMSIGSSVAKGVDGGPTNIVNRLGPPDELGWDL